MRLPSNDFLSLSYLIPTRLSTNPKIQHIMQCADLLQRANFARFWNEVFNTLVSNFNEVNGFAESIRVFVLKSLSYTFKSITLSALEVQLCLDTPSIVAFCNSHGSIVEKVVGDIVVFATNEDIQHKSSSFESPLEMEESLRAIECLRSVQ
eukprot:CAMPEP_0201104910 /NCGR_PEP_ID=MMETSP0812-20130820/42044_1 /ASSEMBLY_ACC=CAM_ASM_000668 /TAXON_ID=98059 /ORGANISM="Dinobryon sp., Strain UTEXLB2267" /LENGTH=150 /DNA_ID=CAMNT_0047364355 /DNA_START=135 /DNA_END=587 /DNA_ORIENTATION=-